MTDRRLKLGFAHPFLILGLVGVLVLAGAGFWLYTNYSSGKEVPLPEIVTRSLPKPELELTLERPADGDVVVDKELMIKGRTLPGIVVVMYTETDENSVESDATGNFEGSLTLEEGINGVVVTAVDGDGEEKTVNLDVVYDSGVN